MNGNGNGSRPPILFPQAGGVPIIGQPTNIGWVFTHVFACSCEQKRTLVLTARGQLGAAVRCSCGRVYKLKALMTNEAGQLLIGLGVTVDAEAEPATQSSEGAEYGR